MRGIRVQNRLREGLLPRGWIDSHLMKTRFAILARDIAWNFQSLLVYILIFRSSIALYPSVLDIGCGRQSELTRFFRKSHPSNPRRFIVGLDLHFPTLKEARLGKIYDDLIMADARYLPLRRKSFDIILLFEFIEHLNRIDGEHFLETLELIARQQIAVTTPNGPFCQGMLDNNIWQAHRSAWRPKDFEIRGYSVIEFPGSIARSDKGSLGWFRYVNDVASLLPWFFQPFPFHSDRLRSRIFCVRNLAKGGG